MARIKYNAILLFTNQLSSMISSQLPLVPILDGLSKESLSRGLLAIISKVKEDVENGVDFGYAISQHPEVFDAIYVNMVKAGMATGRLDRTLEQLALYMQATADTRGKLKTAFAYPLFMIFFLIIVFMFMTFKIMPTFQTLFSSFGDTPLPLPTRIMMNIGKVVSDNLPLIIITFLLITGGIIFVLKNPTARFYWDQYKLKIPVLGDLMKKAAMGKFLRAFAVLTQSEVLIIDSLILVAGAGYNKYLEYQINEAAEMIERGLSVAGAFRKTEFFPEIIIQMITSGEKTGRLGELLEGAAKFYDEQVEESLRNIVALINPVITVLTGATIGLMMVALFLPIFELGGAMKG